MKNLLIYCAFIYVLSGCQSVRIGSTLTAAKKLMQEQPDSALTLLQSINRNSLREEKTKARFALLYSQALDKNYIDIDNDSLIHVALKYLEDHGTNKEKCLAYYYLGRVQCNANNYTKAVVSYIQAKKYAERLSDHYYLGLIYSQIGDIYGMYYNYPSSIDAYKKAYDQYSLTTYISHQQYALLDLAAAYLASKQYNNSIQILSRMLKDSIIKSDPPLQAGCLRLLAANYDNIDQPSKAKKLLLSARYDLNEPISINDYLILAHAFSKENKLDSMEIFFDAARHCAVTDREKAQILFSEYKINKYRRNYMKAIENLEKCMNFQDSVARLTLNQSVISAQRDYFEDQSEFALFKLTANKRLSGLLLCIFLLIFVGVIAYFHYMRKVKNLEIAEYLAMAHRIEDTLQAAQENVQKKDEQQARMSVLIQYLFREKFDLIDRLGNTYYERQNSKSERDAIFNEVKAEIKKLGSDRDTKQQLEQIVNACKDNVMQRLRQQLPEIKENDFELLCYIFAGFSFRAISIFTKDKVENLYTRKSRLKTKISKSNAPDKFFFINSIN